LEYNAGVPLRIWCAAGAARARKGVRCEVFEFSAHRLVIYTTRMIGYAVDGMQSMTHQFKAQRMKIHLNT